MKRDNRTEGRMEAIREAAINGETIEFSSPFKPQRKSRTESKPIKKALL